MRTRFRLPPAVPQGARVRVVATSWAVDADRFEAGLASLRALGFEPLPPPNLTSRHGFLAGDDGARRAALEEALDDPDARVVWVAQGGYGATRLLGGLDPARVARAGKWLVGFSDATALHAVWQRAGLASIHGPNLTTLPRWSDAARAELAALLFEGRAPSLPCRPAAGSTTGHGGFIEGVVMGGNLSVLAAMIGTGCLPSFEDALLLLEDVDEATHRVDRMATQLRQSGVLAGVRAVLLGQFTKCQPSHGDAASAEDVLVAIFAAEGIPVFCGLPVGHERSARTVLFGGGYTVRQGEMVPV